MTDATTEFFDRLARRGHEPMLERTKGTMRIEIVGGRKTERWLVAVDKGDIAVSHKSAGADVVLRTDKASFDAMAGGKMNAAAAVLRGELAVEGDWELMVLFQRLLPGPPTSRASRPGGNGRKRR